MSSPEKQAWERLPDLAGRALGGTVLAASDDFFADKENLITAAEPSFEAQTFGPKGQRYDGWETRRRRGGPPGAYDWALVRLAVPGVVHGVVVDTAWFLGNFPERAAVHGADLPGYPTPADLLRADWFELVPESPLRGGTRNAFDVAAPRRATHVKLDAHPDGGIARLRVHGTPAPDWASYAGVSIDLAATLNGAAVTACSDDFYSSPANMLQPGRSLRMSDGWETARRRRPGNEWAVIRLGRPDVPVLAELDTTHYRGNAPASFSLAGIATGADPDPDDPGWRPLLADAPLLPDVAHRFPLTAGGPVSHVRLDIRPDGGVARLRLWNRPA